MARNCLYRPFNRVGELRTATSTFTQLLSFEEVLQVNMVLNVHRNHKAYLGRGRGVKVNIVLSVRISLVSIRCIVSEHLSLAKRHRFAREETGEIPGG